MPPSQSVAAKMHRARGDLGTAAFRTRQLAASGAARKLLAILDEIDETMLPRMLDFSVGGNAVLQMDVGSRRMFHLVKFESTEPSAPSPLAFLPRDETNISAQVREVAGLLVSLVSLPGPVEVSSVATSKTYSSSEVGFTAQELRTACLEQGLVDAEEIGLSAAEAPADPAADAQNLEGAVEDAPVPGEAVAADQPVAKVNRAPPPDEKFEVMTPERFFELAKDIALNGMILALDGAVLGVFGAGVQETWLDNAGHAAVDFADWLEVAGWVLGKDQFLVLKGEKFEDSSIGVLFKDDRYVAIAMRNLDLNKIIKLGMQALDKEAAA